MDPKKRKCYEILPHQNSVLYSNGNNILLSLPINTWCLSIYVDKYKCILTRGGAQSAVPMHLSMF